MKAKLNKGPNFNLFEKVGALDVLLFTRHLSIMLKSGISIAEAIEIIEGQTQNKLFKRIVRSIRKTVISGRTLSKALSEFPRVFDSFYLSLISIGEESGNLEKNLDYLALQIKKNLEFKKKVQGALLYPAIILSTAVLAGSGISIFILPKLVDLLTSLDVELPFTTKVLIFAGTAMKGYGFFIFGGLIALLILIRTLINLPAIRPYWQKFILSIPVYGPFVQNVELASFCRNLGIMLSSGLPIVTALSTQAEATTNIIYKKYFKTLTHEVERGKSIEEIFSSSNFKYIPLIAARMIGVGEKTGKLDESLLYLGDYFEDEVDSATKNFAIIIEPAILIFVGLIVAFIAISIISPIYQFTGGIGK